MKMKIEIFFSFFLLLLFFLLFLRNWTNKKGGQFLSSFFILPQTPKGALSAFSFVVPAFKAPLGVWGNKG